eukprot:TRINITY_DN5815_c0_g1_i1.p1 TRINITY_DN5815_c0_g1~~TRINITY_DN5815_c0_g1_i1.p1  ORF type:complete len:776 (+),score=232.99 TRINITY_DN5815_c0_g1_i1:124-2328(+)
MNNRQLRRLHQLSGVGKRIDPALDLGLQAAGGGGASSEEDDAGVAAVPTLQPSGKQRRDQKKKKKRQAELSAVAEDDYDDDDEKSPKGAAPAAAPPRRPQPSAKAKRDEKKKGGAPQQQPTAAAAAEEDVDAILAAYQQKAAAAGGGASGASAAVSAPLPAEAAELGMLLRCNAQNLDAEAELRAMFGSAAVEQERRESGRGGAPQRHVRTQGAAPYRPQARMKGCALAKPDPQTWPKYAADGLEMVMQMQTLPAATQEGEDPSASSCSVAQWEFRESGKYLEASAACAHAMGAASLHALNSVLARVPYHAPCLLQLSRAATTMGEFAEGEELLQHALYAFGRAGESAGFSWLQPFTARELSVKRGDTSAEACCAAIRLRALDLLRRGCFRTALEWLKLLWNLNADDPLRAFLLLDYAAAKAGQWRWYLDLLQSMQRQAARPRLRRMARLPCAAYGGAMAARLLERGGKGGAGAAELLRAAVSLYPAAVPRLLQEAGQGTAQLPDGWAPPAAAVAEDGTAGQLCRLYVARSGELWRTPELAGWLAETARAVSDGAQWRCDEAAKLLDGPEAQHYSACSVDDHVGRMDVIPEDALLDEEEADEGDGLQQLLPGFFGAGAAGAAEGGAGNGEQLPQEQAPPGAAASALELVSSEVEAASAEVAELVSLRADGVLEPDALAAAQLSLGERLTQLLLRVDAVQVGEEEGEEEAQARSRRRQLVQEVLQLLDAVGQDEQ